MTMFTIAMTVLMVIIALGQLAISVAMLSSSSRRAIANWIAWGVNWVIFFLMISVGAYGFWRFASAESPEKLHYYVLAFSAGSMGASFAVLISILHLRLAFRLQGQINLLHKHLGYPFEPWRKDSGG